MEEGWPPSAEAAITVQPGWRTCGLGTELLRGLIRYARNRWIARLWMICLADNVAMRKIASKCGASLTLCSSQVEARITPPYPTPFTMWDEAVEEARGLARSITLRTGLAAPEDARREVASATG
jgi:GNAT superfamily N-acetyltransferase